MRLFRHIGWAEEVVSARKAGEGVRVLCGRTVRPLGAAALTSLPTCPKCALRRNVAIAEGRASFIVTNAWRWISAETSGGAA